MEHKTNFQSWRRVVMAIVHDNNLIPKEQTRLTRTQYNDKGEKLPRREYKARIVGRYELRRGWANKIPADIFIHTYYERP